MIKNTLYRYVVILVLGWIIVQIFSNNHSVIGDLFTIIGNLSMLFGFVASLVEIIQKVFKSRETESVEQTVNGKNEIDKKTISDPEINRNES